MRIVEYHIPSLIELGKPFTVVVELDRAVDTCIIDVVERRSGLSICRYEGAGRIHSFKCVAYGAPGTYVLNIVARNPTKAVSVRPVIVSFTTSVPMQYVIPINLVSQVVQSFVAVVNTMFYMMLVMYIVNIVARVVEVIATARRRVEERRGVKVGRRGGGGSPTG